MNKVVKIGIEGINPLSGNRGVGALAYSTIFILKEIERLNDVKFEFYLIDSNSKKIVININSQLVELNCITSLSFSNLLDYLRFISKPSLIKSFFAYLKIDFFFTMCQGDSYSDIYGEERFNWINHQHKLMRLFRKPYVFLPQTIGPFSNKRILKQAIHSLRKAKFVMARDFQSALFVKENSLQRTIYEAIDMAFYLPYQKIFFSNDYVHVGLNISALLWNGGYMKNNQFKLKVEYRKLVDEIINYLLVQPNVLIHIVPHVVEPNSGIENDYEISSTIVSEYNNNKIVLAPFFMSPIEAKNYISGLNFFAGSRMHATIAAFSSGVPVYPMAYSRKFSGLFRDTLDYPFLGDMTNESAEKILFGFKNAFESKYDLKMKIHEKLNSVVVDKKCLIIESLKEFLKVKL